MLEILQFVMSDFWIFIGTAILVSIVTTGLASMIRAVWGKE